MKQKILKLGSAVRMAARGARAVALGATAFIGLSSSLAIAQELEKEELKFGFIKLT
ncbi:MAG TPA: nitrate ABC transporter substrate-binding protein, partial [Alphaproteobacteria bacterium]|nr:nitrate ABC transporter substrate-binding protein [Alphaproteobacteria bacterium]